MIQTLNINWFEFSQMLTSANPKFFFLVCFIFLGLVFISIWIIHRIISARENTILLQSNGIQTYRTAIPLLRKELDRLRRYKRSLSVIVLQFQQDPSTRKLQLFNGDDGNGHGHEDVDEESYSPKNGDDNGGNGNRHGSEINNRFENYSIEQLQMTILFYNSIIHDLLRECDIITFDTIHNHFIIFLPETNRLQAAQSIERIDRIISERTNAHFSATITEFPKDGYTVEDLVKTAMTRLGDPLNTGGSHKIKELTIIEQKQAS